MASTDAQLKPPEKVFPAAAQTAPAETEPSKEKMAKSTKENKPRALKTTPAHPPYFQMIKEAISALKEKGGSSPRAIAKFMEEKHKAVLSLNYKKMLAVQIKKLVLSGKLVKVKGSFKLSDEGKKAATKKIVRKTAKPATKTASKVRSASKSAAKTAPKAKSASKPAKPQGKKVVKKVTKAPVAAKATKPTVKRSAPVKKTAAAKPMKVKKLKSIKSVKKTPAKSKPAGKAPPAKKAKKAA